MSRRDNMKRIYVGNLPPDVRTRDVEDLFYKFGKIAFIDLKNRRGPPFAFVEFLDYRDAEEAVRARDGKKFDGCRLRVEFPRGRERPSRFKNGSGPHSRSAAPQRRSKFRVKVSGLPHSGSWQDLKDHMREFGEVCFADVYKGGEGVVEFVNYDDMRYAIKKLNDTKFKSHEGETAYIKLREDIPSGDSRSRSRSPIERTRRRSRSPAYQRDRSPPPSSRRRRGGSSNNRRANSRSRSRSRTPRGGGGAGSDKGRSRSRSPSNRSDRASLQSRDRSRSRSRTPRSGNDNGQTPSPVGKDDKPRRQRSATPDSVASDKDKLKRRSSVSPRREDDNHKSGSRSPRQRSGSPAQRSGGSRSPSSRSGSRSYSASHSSRSVSRTPTPVEE